MFLTHPLICSSLALGALGILLPTALAEGHGAHGAHHERHSEEHHEGHHEGHHADHHANHHDDHHVSPADEGSSTAALIGSDGSEIGSLTLKQGPHGLMLRVEVSPQGLSPGWHGLHLHQVGDCSDPGSYTRSGGHVGKRAGGHGLMNPDGMEAGDLPNIWAAADGSAGYETVTNQTSLSALTEGDGSALIIHAGPDDHQAQPIGGAGARVACGVIS